MVWAKKQKTKSRLLFNSQKKISDFQMVKSKWLPSYIQNPDIKSVQKVKCFF